MNILIICNTDGAVRNFRGPLIKRHVAKGHTVVCLCNLVDNYEKELYEFGVKSVVNFNFNPRLKNFVLFPKIFKKIIRDNEITHIHVYTITCILFFLFVPRVPKNIKIAVCTFTGMGRLFSHRSSVFSRTVILLILSFILKKFNSIFLQNLEDYTYFRTKLKFYKSKFNLVYGSGIDAEEINFDAKARIEFKRKLDSKGDFKFVCLMTSRLVKDKGYEDFYACADLMTDLNPDILFVHTLAKSYPDEQMPPSTKNLLILPESKDYKALLSLADVFVLPSYYREGIPRSLIEAVLFNKRIVTTNFSGCKHTVVEGGNGFLVPPKSPVDLAQAILSALSLKTNDVERTNKLLFNSMFDVNIHFNKNLDFYDRF